MIDNTRLVETITKQHFVAVTGFDCSRDMAVIEDMYTEWLIYSKLLFSLLHKDRPAEVVVLVPNFFVDFLEETEGIESLDRISHHHITLVDYFPEDEIKFCIGKDLEQAKLWANEPSDWVLMFAELGTDEYVMERVFA